MGLSRNEDILQSIVDGTQYTDPPKSRVEDLLLQVKKVIEEGGGGTGDYDDLENKPQVNGVTLSGNKSAADLSLASLDANGKVPAAQLPSYVDDIINGYLHDGKFYEDDQYTTEITAEDGKIYVDLATNKTYRWSGLAYVEVSESLALGETSSTAYAGDKGKANADAITAITNGTDIDSFADVETALAGKQGTLTAGDYINLNNGDISVNRNLVVDNYLYTIESNDAYYITVTKSQGGEIISTNTYSYSRGTVTNVDGNFTITHDYDPRLGYVWVYTSLKDSAEHTTGYTWTKAVTDTPFSETEAFPSEDVSGYKLVIKSEMDTALSGKQDTLTFDDVPTDNSNNPVKSNGIYDALVLKQNATDNSLETEAKTIVGAINEHEGDIGSLMSGLTNVENELNGDATVYPYADVITIPDAVPANLADCTVKIEPVQDLHGYDHPWVGGAGKNKCAGTYTTTTNGGVTFTANSDGTVSATDTSSGYAYVNSSEFTIKAGTYIFSGAPSGNSKYVLAIYSGATLISQISNGTETVVTFESDTNVVVRCVVNGADVTTGVTYKPMIRLSTETDDTFAPYTNICPISGHTEASVTDEGTQLVPNGTDTSNGYKDNYYLTSNGVENTGGDTYISDYFDVVANVSYILKDRMKNANAASVCFYNANKQYISGYAVNKETKIITTPSNAVYARCTQIKNLIENEIYFKRANQYTIALGDTIYGGTVDFDSGVMTVTHKYVDLSTLSFALASGNRWATQPIADAKLVPDTQVANAYCSTLSIQSKNDITDNESLIGISVNYQAMFVARNGSDTDAPTGDFVYELATPTTIQLTPQQIQLLKGTNTITASTGQISVTVNGVSGAIGALTANKQDKTDYELETTAKTVVGGINELKSDLTNKIEGIFVPVTTDDGRYCTITFSNINVTRRTVFAILIGSALADTKLALCKAYADNNAPAISSDDQSVTFDVSTMTLTIDVGTNAWTRALIIAPSGLFTVAS